MLTIFQTLFMIYSSSSNCLSSVLFTTFSIFLLLFPGIILFSSLHCCGLKVSYEMFSLISYHNSRLVQLMFEEHLIEAKLTTKANCEPIPLDYDFLCWLQWLLNLIMKFIGACTLWMGSHNSVKYLHSWRISPSNDKGLCGNSKPFSFNCHLQDEGLTFDLSNDLHKDRLR